MPRLIVDDREIEVPAGTKVIEAAERLGIMIPRFCYHEAMGSVGACRMCAVKFLQGPFKGVQMSCMIEAQDGMVVSTTDEEAVEFRKFVIECLMLNHPHDCPVCDEGGQCLLQDETVSGGHGMRRYLGKKRTYRDQYLGAFISHEMNRCIHCYRCSRFYQEFSGYRDLGPLQIGSRVFFGRFSDGQLESPFSGNLLDICPTGVYTDKPSRFKARYWDLQRSPSLCIHCSLGCNTVANARYREVVRVEARLNRAVNGYFICDRGRYGFAYANLSERPRVARTPEGESPLPGALHMAAEELKRITRSSGSGAVACLGSARSSLETQSMLKRLCHLLGWVSPNYFVDPVVERKVSAAVSSLDESVAVSLREIEEADFIVAVGVDPVNEAPMLALAMRQAFRKEAVIVVIDPRPVFLPFAFTHLAVSPDEMEPCLSAIIGRTGSGIVVEGGMDERSEEGRSSKDALSPEIQEKVLVLAERLRTKSTPVVICGTDLVRETTPALAAVCSKSLSEAKGRGGIFYTLPGPNAFGAALFNACRERSFPEVLESIEAGMTRALVVVESDPFGEFSDRRRLEAAFEKLDFVLVLDYLPSETVRRAGVFLPTTTHFETGSVYINQEGRLQYAESLHYGGIPLEQMSGGSHPPRVFGRDIPGGDPVAAWIILTELARTLGAPEGEILGFGPWSPIVDEIPALKKLERVSFPPEGLRILPEKGGGQGAPKGIEFPPVHRDADLRGAGALELFLVDRTFGTEELSTYSEIMRQVEEEPCVWMHVDDAARAGLSPGKRVTISLDGGPLEVKLCLCEKMARGMILLPRHRRLDWQKLKCLPSFLPLDRVK